MALTKLDQLYRQVLLTHSRYPQNKGELTTFTCSQSGSNPSCGDQISVQVMVKEGVISQIAWQGSGCTISQASASIMTTLVIGKSVQDTKALCQSFFDLVTGEEWAQQNSHLLGDAQVFSSVKNFPARIKCATLAWHTLSACL
ncbi:SUF system NifU family Fe-S cluster assembly protein [Weissella diestrammenae]|uniref:SUF system NifU family Fe-S cluster assembly protein n=1 Tax=Weissella diestrammenae TaxID=1162633 RepID=A0A7G9T4X3_9LACO|nr:SUF system NifU family Fe-S cluster assembly protein [Weissella diestrammenae]MCM0582865.1 SUF system NifU family Fe-S cluster assembly protein [Weissella diestrammenae]QNN75148.1 SUF system NifU family Fe-S cluster assembly protein [Weissella diestrammenae]